MLQEFARKYKNLEDLVCLRDTPCPNQWPAQPYNPDAPHTARSLFRHLEEEHGFVAPEWCIPCKVVHSIRLGLKFTTIRTVPITAAEALTAIDLNVLDDPVLQHRGRMRRAQACLSQLTQDYARLITATQLPNTKSDESTNQIVPSTSSLCHLLDTLWVRPVRLVSRSQLKESIPSTFLNDNNSATAPRVRPDEDTQSLSNEMRTTNKNELSTIREDSETDERTLL
ncbi:unnamed protein product, partial [Echinostoma caproni]|uniref:Uncharacterized protein n=1 Tax=Echinostoma caproni TaxID=27848 RepID=A0A183B9N1_9TREM